MSASVRRLHGRSQLLGEMRLKSYLAPGQRNAAEFRKILEHNACQKGQS